MVFEQVLTIGNAAILAAVYATLGFLSRKRTKGEALNSEKVVTTVLLGLVVGALGAWRGEVITPETLTPDYLAAKEVQYGTVILGLEKVLDLLGVLPRLRALVGKVLG